MGISSDASLCVDLRAVNAVTVPSAWPMPNLEVAMQSLRGMRFFAVIDLWQGYWQFPLAEESRETQSIMTYEGVYKPMRIIQGSTNSVINFQSNMQGVLGDNLYNTCLLWVDDILVYAITIRELLHILERIFKSLEVRKIKCTVVSHELLRL